MDGFGRVWTIFSRVVYPDLDGFENPSKNSSKYFSNIYFFFYFSRVIYPSMNGAQPPNSPN